MKLSVSSQIWIGASYGHVKKSEETSITIPLSSEVSQILYALLNLSPSTCPSITPHVKLFYLH